MSQVWVSSEIKMKEKEINEINEKVEQSNRSTDQQVNKIMKEREKRVSLIYRQIVDQNIAGHP